MPAGRPRTATSPTKFLNVRRRRISRTAEGKFVVRTAKGGLVYEPKARFVSSPGGSTTKKVTKSMAIPTKIRPKFTKDRVTAGPRKPRANKGKARGPRGLMMLAKTAFKF